MNITETLLVVEYLPNYFCQFIDLPENGTECSPNFPQVCVGCHTVGKFLTGETLKDYFSPGHIICIIMWIATIVIGTLGVITNSIIIMVIQHMRSKRPFDFLIMMLACFDLICCASAATVNTAAVSIYGNSLEI